MTLAEALALSAADFDAMASESLARSEACLRDCGADDEEVEALMQRYRAEMAAVREQHLAEVRGWLMRGCAPLH